MTDNTPTTPILNVRRLPKFPMRVLLSLCAILVLTAAVAGEASQGSGSPVALQMRFKPGDASRYNMTMLVTTAQPGVTASTNAYDFRANLIVEQRVNRVEANGNGQLAVKTVSGSGVSNGALFQADTEAKPALITFDPRGTIVGVQDMPVNSSNQTMLGSIFSSGTFTMQGVYLPAKPVHPGDSWSQKVALGGLGGGGSAVVRSTFVRVDKISHFRTARLHSVLTMPISAGLDAKMQPTAKAGVTASMLTGTLKMTYDTDFAITEGKVVRCAGDGMITVDLVQNAAPNSPAHPLSKNIANNGRNAISSNRNAMNRNSAESKKKSPPQSGRSTGTSQKTAAPESLKITLHLHLGNNLMQ